MQVHAEYDPREGTYRIWAWERRQDAVLPYEYEEGRGLVLSGEEAAPAESFSAQPASMVLPYEVAEALVSALDPGLNPRNALSTHLKDACATRDRLLAIVEKRL